MQVVSQASTAITPIPRILALQGESSWDIQALLAQSVVMWRAAGLRLAGVLEHVMHLPEENRVTRVLTDLSTGHNYRVTQKLGAGAVACNIDTTAFAASCAGVEAAIDRGCDLAIISKFGKLEMEHGELVACITQNARFCLPWKPNGPAASEGVPDVRRAKPTQPFGFQGKPSGP
jgi:hypothetical protein